MSSSVNSVAFQVEDVLFSPTLFLITLLFEFRNCVNIRILSGEPVILPFDACTHKIISQSSQPVIHFKIVEPLPCCKLQLQLQLICTFRSDAVFETLFFIFFTISRKLFQFHFQMVFIDKVINFYHKIAFEESDLCDSMSSKFSIFISILLDWLD